jgi:hypothetical protein
LSAGASEAHSVAPTTEGEESEGSGDYDSEELEEIFSIGTALFLSSSSLFFGAVVVLESPWTRRAF